MRICIWFTLTSSAWGGSNSFLRTLAVELRRQGHTVTHTPNPQDDVVLLNSWTRGQGGYIHLGHFAELRATGRATWMGRFLPPSFWQQRPRGGPALVHRVDGIAQLYGRNDPRADTVQFTIANQVDAVIFQSRFSQQSFASVGVVPADSRVIHNAVDGGLFSPAASPPPLNSASPLRLVMSSWSNNPRKGFHWLTRLSSLPGIEACFIGRWPEGIDPRNVHMLGVLQASEISAVLRQNHALVHGAENDPCPNAVLEALACGLPILYHPSGGTPELAGEYGLPLVEPLDQLPPLLLSQYDRLRQRLVENQERFLIEQAARQYLAVFQAAQTAHLERSR